MKGKIMSDDYTYQAYRRDLKEYAKSVLNEVKEYDTEISDEIHTVADSTPWVIYYARARQTIEYSQNSDAYADNDIELDGSKGFNAICVTVAYWAFQTDLAEMVAELQEEEDTE
jgi:hypothetical protein